MKKLVISLLSLISFSTLAELSMPIKCNALFPGGERGVIILNDSKKPRAYEAAVYLDGVLKDNLDCKKIVVDQNYPKLSKYDCSFEANTGSLDVGLVVTNFGEGSSMEMYGQKFQMTCY